MKKTAFKETLICH